MSAFRERSRCLSGIAVLAAVATACSPSGEGSDGDDSAYVEPGVTAASLGDQTVLTASEYLDTPPYSYSDPGYGETLARQCLACHTLAAGGANMLGPNLHGFFGREVGAVSGFSYSTVLREAEFVWTPQALDAWLAQPARFLPGNRMAYPGLADPDDRNDLITYLLEATAAE